MYQTGVTQEKLDLSQANFFIVLNLLDYLTTHLLISMDGEELMPLGASVISDYGMPGLLFYKLSVTLAVLIIAKRFRFKDSLWNLLNGAFTGVILWNNLGVFLSLLLN